MVDVSNSPWFEGADGLKISSLTFTLAESRVSFTRRGVFSVRERPSGDLRMGPVRIRVARASQVGLLAGMGASPRVGKARVASLMARPTDGGQHE